MFKTQILEKINWKEGRRVVEMLHTGLGTTSLNALLVCMNIPSISPKSLKAREREVGRKIEDIAKTSCEECAAKEIEFGISICFVFF